MDFILLTLGKDFISFHCLYFIRRSFYDKRMAQEVDAGCLGDEWKVMLCNTVYF